MVTLYLSEFIMIGTALLLLCALPLILMHNYKTEIEEVKQSAYRKGYYAGLYQKVIKMSSDTKAE